MTLGNMMTIQKIRIMLFSVFCSMISLVLCQEASAQISTASSIQDPFGSSASSARDMALGNSFVGIADDSTALFYNPAGLATLKESDMGLTHMFGLAGIFEDQFTIGMPLEKGFGLGFSAQVVDYGSFDGRNADGTPAANPDAYEFGLGAGTGVELFRGFSLGIEAKGTMQQLASYSYSLFDVDAGFLCVFPGNWRFGTSLLNFGTTANGANSSTIVRSGLSKLFDPWGSFQLLSAASYSYELQYGSEANAGVELSFKNICSLRVGYELQLQDTGIDGLQGLTAGAGVGWEGLRLDYAFIPYGNLGTVNMVSLDYAFGGPKPTASATPTAVTSVTPTTTMIATVQPQAVASTPGTVSGQSLVVQFDLASSQMANAQTLEQQGKYNEAVSAYNEIIRANPQNTEALWRLGNLYYRMKYVDYAAQCFEAVLKLRPNEKSLADWLTAYRARAVQPTPTATPIILSQPTPLPTLP